MNNSVIASLCVTMSILGALRAGATFQNLGFEAAQLTVVTPPNVIDAASALPGWAAFSGTNQLPTIRYDDFSAVDPVVLVASDSVISGDYSVWLGPRGSLSQIGVVPVNAQSLLFKSFTSPVFSSLQVLLDGQRLQAITLADRPEYRLAGVDVSSFVGQAVTLTFEGGGGVLDDIEFSAQAIPEPSVLALVVVAGGLMMFRRRKL